jgi:hypothetical protein
MAAVTGTVRKMSSDAEIAQRVGRRADSRLLDEADALLPAEIGRPVAIPTDPGHDSLVKMGATLTAVTLVGGILLMLIGLVTLLAGAGDEGLAGLILGGVLTGTHWGWVHVAEATVQRRARHRNAGLIEGRDQWLEHIEPYAHWSVITEVRPDGAIEIQRILHEPVPLGDDRFTFARSVEQRELHSGDEPGAAVTERAEQMRHEAAADTAREEARYRVAAEAYHDALLRHDDADQQLAAVRAASQALSERINENLREPPLAE